MLGPGTRIEFSTYWFNSALPVSIINVHILVLLTKANRVTTNSVEQTVALRIEPMLKGLLPEMLHGLGICFHILILNC